MSRRILIAGCGYLGCEVAEQLLKQGFEVLGLTHSESSAEALRHQLSIGVETADLSSIDSITDLAARIPKQDAILHCASSGRGGVEAYEAVYYQGCQNLLKAFPGARLVFTSSTSVYPQVNGEEVTESSPANPDRETGQVLRKTEDLMVGEGGVVARLAGIYGPGRSVILQRFLDGSARIEEGVSRFLNQIHRDDAASALVLLLNKEDEVQGRIFNVVDGNPLTQRACYEQMAQHFDLSIPPEAPRDLNRKRGWTHKRINNQRLRDLGWNPKFPSFLETLEKDERFLPSIEQLVGHSP